MTDDPKWNGTGYSPSKAWAEIQRKDSAREFEAKYPTKWWETPVYTTAGLLLLGGLLLCAFWLLQFLAQAFR